MYSLDNVYNWGKTYKSPFDRWKDMYKQYLENGTWNGTCIRCNNITEKGKGWRHCDKCYNEYENIKHKYRNKAYNLLKNKSNDLCKITGCSKQMLKYYFELLFDSNMNWNNRNEYWQIDHRIPLAWFNLENEKELYFACNYKNLQPMEKLQNVTLKNCNYPENDLFSYAFQSSQTS
jgi:hypothetical protein